MAENNDDGKYCKKCGASMDGGSGPRIPQISSRVIYVEREKKSLAPIALAVVLLLVLCPIGYLLIFEGNTAHYDVYVRSTHISETVDVEVYLNDDKIASWSNLKPGSYYHFQHWQTHRFPVYKDKVNVVFLAKSTGGGLGSVTDSEIVIIEKGGRHTVDLYV